MYRLHDVARDYFSGDPSAKPLEYYTKYDQYFKDKQIEPLNILEIGVHKGESTKVFAKTFPAAKIVALDIELTADFSQFPQVVYLKVDQTDKAALEGVISEHFSSGIDVVIDDASHIGAFTKTTFEVVFPYVRRGGVYIIEDWGTGYWDKWPDGARFQDYPLSFHDGHIPRRIPSHDLGMVGFVKSLVDLTSGADMRPSQEAPRSRATILKSLEFSTGICIAQKA